jgi:putative hemolysin
VEQEYQAATIAGLITEIAGRIPLPGEVIVADSLRFEVVASTDRRIERVRVSAIESVSR